MKTWVAFLACFAILFLPLPAEAASRASVTGKAYNVEVRSVDVVYSLDGTFRALETVRTTGRQENVNSVRFAYDFEQEQAEAAGRFLEDQKVALVRVDGFDPRIGAIAEAERVAVTVDGQELQADSAADFADYVGWHNVHSGSYGVVFPIFLGKESRQETHVVQVTALLTQDGVEREITETAVLTLALENEHVYKEKRALRILNMAGTHVDAYCVGDRIYLDYPSQDYYNYQEWVLNREAPAEVEITFADAAGQAIPGIAWAAQARSEAGETAALFLEAEGKLEDGKAVFRAKPDSRLAERQKVVFTVETAEAVYRTPEMTIVEREDIPGRDPKGLYFAQSEITLAVGQCFDPVVLAVADGLPVRDGGVGELQIALGQGSDRTVLEVTEEGRVYASRPGAAYITATYETGRVTQDSVGNMHRDSYGAPSMKITVVPAGAAPAEVAPADAQPAGRAWYVACRTLNVRAGADTAQPVLRTHSRGERLDVVRVADGWAELAQGGFVKAEYLLWV